jgi:hypothetical protein
MVRVESSSLVIVRFMLGAGGPGNHRPRVKDRGSCIVDRGSWAAGQGSWVVNHRLWIDDRGIESGGLIVAGFKLGTGRLEDRRPWVEDSGVESGGLVMVGFEMEARRLRDG